MAGRHRIVFLDRETLPDDVVLGPPDFPHEMILHQSTHREDVEARIAEADIVITNKVPLRGEVLSKAKKLKLIAVAATGTDIIDLPACRTLGIAVSNIRGYAVNTVPEHTLALILALRRSLVSYRQSVLDGRWQEAGQFCYFDYPVHDLAGSTLGIVGSGTLGRSVARLAEALGMRIMFSGRKGSSALQAHQHDFDAVLAESDIITLHCPLTPETRHLIGAEEFARMQRRPLLINTARGGLVDEEALEAALDAGLVSGAGIDVTTPEPPPADSVIMRLAQHPNVIVTPHVAWASREAIQVLVDQLVINIEQFVAGAPRNIVT